MSTVGYGDVRPYTTLETWFNTFVCLLGSIFFSFIIGAFQNIFLSVDEFGLSSFSRQQDEIERFLKYQKCSTRLQRTCLEHASMAWTENNVVNPDALIERLPSGLKERIAMELHGEILLNVSFMTFWTNSLKARFAHHLRVVYFCAKDPICRRMEKNSNLYIISSGKVNFELHITQGRRRSIHRETFTLTRGDFFGESAVVSILENRYNRGFCEHVALAITSCKLLYINAETMRKVLSIVPVQQRTYILQQLSTRPAERLKSRGGSVWLRQCHEAYVNASSTRGLTKRRSNREIKKKGTGTSLVSSKTFERRPIVSSASFTTTNRYRRASFSGVVRRQDDTFWQKYGLNVDESKTSDQSMQQHIVKSRFQRRASFSEVALPSMLSRRLRNKDEQSSMISRSLSFLRNKSNDLFRTLSFSSQTSAGSRDSIISSISSGRFTPIVRRLLGSSAATTPDSSVSITPRRVDDDDDDDDDDCRTSNSSMQGDKSTGSDGSTGGGATAASSKLVS